MFTTTLKQSLVQLTFIFLLLELIFIHVTLVSCAPSESLQKNGIDDSCVHTLAYAKPSFFKRHFDMSFMKKFFKHWVPFTSADRVKMQFYLYKRDFPECGRELRTDDEDSVMLSGFNADHPTRIIIHGWMSQSKGTFNRAVKNAYMNLTKISINNTNENKTESVESNDTMPPPTAGPEEFKQEEGNTFVENDADRNSTIDYNVIVVDWSVISSNVNYFGVVDLIDDLGFLLAEFVRFLHLKANLYFGDVYLIGHSLGAQIAGSAGKQVLPFRFNTIFALDPAGPKFRNRSNEYRLDASDADYVESVQTSSSLGFQEPVGHATFYPNFGRDQKKCYFYGCSHSRAHNYFAESITSKESFWGTRCERQSENIWIMSEKGEEFKMGGEPSTPKQGTFYLKTNDQPPYAMGKRKVLETIEEVPEDNYIHLE
ncbi:pancreatic lipase-related protein 2 [Calliphora vicina]|uniref:pancreatic lipase-related protein 2 n=1 Tax=Calliphora vicina TaxID=7373 RepID=UPI00325B6F87